MNFADAEERDALAGEYVLGLLSPAEMSELEAELARNATLRAAVVYWQERLWPLTEVARPVTPSPALWAWIERDVGAVRPPAQVRATQTRWWDGLAFWRLAAIAASVATVVLAVLLLRPAATSVTFIAVLEAPDKTPGWIVQAAPGQPVKLTPLVKTDVGAKQSLQFWTLIDRAQGPVSLGLVEPGRIATIDAARLPGLIEGQLFEITLEPYGGSPVNRPTGTILYKGLTVAAR